MKGYKKMNYKILKLINLYMKEFKSNIKDFTIINYFEYEYHHTIDIKYIDNDITTVLTLELKVSSNNMLDTIINDKSIKKHIIY